ncbi:UvrD-helicase domain-containing protein [bacterium]|nr:MAG: UvrD-helicase domain-containing protein [bacterium]QQR61531.1 MAG: UvrD-helicase domain-containing protein [bacterium]QQR62941.1 MAG: UvrD-helicase domain-containing protein [bacterium]
MINEQTSILQFICNQLNESQQEAALHTEGNLLVIAGAGSGKTRVITARIAYLLHDLQVPSSAIVALTFTNKAAKEMKERVSTLAPRVIHPFVGTFHGYCLSLLKKYYHNNPFTILDSSDQEKLIKNLLEKLGKKKELTPKTVLGHLSLLRNQHPYGIKPEDFPWQSDLMHDIYKLYTHEKQLCRYFDFDDLLIKTVEILQSDEPFKLKIHATVHHVLVDEYQDTNVVQHLLLKLLCPAKPVDTSARSVCVVGDEDQSIYSWRGATVANIQTFVSDFSNTKLVKIEQNYRSKQEILTVANQLIKNNPQRTPKTLWSSIEGKQSVMELECGSEYQESDAIGSALAQFWKKYPTDTAAVLYRTHTQSRPIEEMCIKYSIPYKIIGGTQFYERAEIKDLIAYLKLILNPFDQLSFFRVLNTPLRGLGEKIEELFRQAWQHEPFLNFYEITVKVMQQKLTPGKIKTLHYFLTIFHELTAQQNASEALKSIIERTGYKEYLYNTYEPENAQERLANIDELIEAAVHFAQEGSGSVQSFLEEVSLMNEKITRKDESKNVVNLMTLHAAKGLEFDFVWIAGVEEQIIPTPRSLYEKNDLEEERRLLYVGITRARSFLCLSYTKHRTIFGTPSYQQQSRFLQEISSTISLFFETSTWYLEKYTTLFKQWFAGSINGTSANQHHKNISLDKTKTVATRFVKKEVHKTSSEPKQNSNHNANQVKHIIEHQPFKIKQKVKHQAYGIGTVEMIEKKESNWYVTVRFIYGAKKILADFLREI